VGILGSGIQEIDLFAEPVVERFVPFFHESIILNFPDYA
jgi:hypothetical protein